MKSGWFPLVPWGLAVVAVAVFGRVAFDLEWLPALLLGGEGLLAALWGVATALVDRRGRRPFADDEPELVVRGSLATVSATIGVTLAVTGAFAIGQSLLWPGLLFLAFGLGGLAREARADRRVVRGMRAPGAPR